MRVLLIEDDPAIAKSIKRGLEQESFAVDIEHNGEEGLQAALAIDYDILIVDIMLPDLDGLSITSQLHQAEVHSPILILSAKDQVPDKILGLQKGADDYLAKPFSFEELLARIKTLLRRPKTRANEVLKIKDLALNTTTNEVRRHGKSVSLSRKEFAILEYLLRNKGMVKDKRAIIEHVWDFDSDILPHNVEAIISNLRRKIGKDLLKTIRGLGYKIEDSIHE